jgi:hypothetical protein
MPDAPNVPTSPHQTQLGSGWFDDVPGGDIDLDVMFPNPELAPQTPPVAPPAAQPPVEPQPFLKTATGTVYKTVEDAVRGTEEKDRVISKLREEAKAREGQDPLHRQPAPQTPKSFREDPSQLFDRLAEAVTKNDKVGYADTLARFQQESLAPYAPLLNEVSREKAIRELESSNRGIREFLGSSDYQATLEALPLLANAIQWAEQTPEAAIQQLPSLYRTAYLTSLGMKAPTLIANAAQQAAVQAPPQPQRPTLQPGNPGLQPSFQPNVTPSLDTTEGRKAIIDSGRQRGLDQQSWKNLGF